MSSGDSTSNLGSINEREIVKTVTSGHSAGKAQFNSSEKATFGQYEEVETEQKFSHNPTAYPQPISTTVSFDPAFNQMNPG